MRWLALGAAVLLSAQNQTALKSTVDTVAVYATVTDKNGALVSDLRREDFEVADNGARRDISVFSSAIQPVTAVLLLDMNGSTKDVPWLQAASEGVLGAMRPEDRLRIGTFGEEITLSARLTGDRSYLTWVLREELWPASISPLWDALDEAASSIAREPGRRDIIVLTNGRELTYAAHPSLRRGAVPERMRREGIGVHAVTFKKASVDGKLKTLVRDSGGSLTVVKDLSFAADAFATIMRRLHGQYLVGFEPVSLDGLLHKIKVSVKRPGLSVETRAHYVASPAR